MGLSSKLVGSHIAAWQERLGKEAYSFRDKWPRYLFHHAPIENALEILSAGCVYSRNDPDNPKPRDIAGAGVIEVTAGAHDFARLYFRPMTPTQWNVEGVRRPDECMFGAHAHAPVLVMFVFDAESVLTMGPTCFSEGNMQRPGTAICKKENEFLKIPFEKVFHFGGNGFDDSVKYHRCAEVLAKSPLSCDDNLKWIYCRSEAEKDFLVHELNFKTWIKWRNKIIVSDDLKVFQKDKAFVERVWLESEGVRFELNPRSDGATIVFKIEVFDENGDFLFERENATLSPVNPTGKPWRARQDLKDGIYRVKILIEGHRVYDNILGLGDALF